MQGKPGVGDCCVGICREEFSQEMRMRWAQKDEDGLGNGERIEGILEGLQVRKPRFRESWAAGSIRERNSGTSSL